jgi:hypothetical protein
MKDEVTKPKIVIQPEGEPLLSIAKLVAEYGMDEVVEAISMVEIYVH